MFQQLPTSREHETVTEVPGTRALIQTLKRGPCERILDVNLVSAEEPNYSRVFLQVVFRHASTIRSQTVCTTDPIRPSVTINKLVQPQAIEADSTPTTPPR